MRVRARVVSQPLAASDSRVDRCSSQFGDPLSSFFLSPMHSGFVFFPLALDARRLGLAFSPYDVLVNIFADKSELCCA